MVTDRQLAANRANAAHSTGPRTPEGKARSAQNARKNIFDAAAFAIPRPEDAAELQQLRADIVAAYQPANSQELFACDRLAVARQSVLRAACLQSGLFTLCLDTALDRSSPMAEDLVGDLAIAQAQNLNYALAQGFHRLIQQGRTWDFFLRYQGRVEREYRHALEDLRRVLALREKLKNEAISDPPSEPPQPDPPPPPAEPLPALVPAPAPPPQKMENEPIMIVSSSGTAVASAPWNRPRMAPAAPKVVARPREQPGAR